MSNQANILTRYPRDPNNHYKEGSFRWAIKELEFLGATRPAHFLASNKSRQWITRKDDRVYGHPSLYLWSGQIWVVLRGNLWPADRRPLTVDMALLDEGWYIVDQIPFCDGELNK